MSICRLCKEDISYLKNIVSGTKRYDLRVNRVSKEDYADYEEGDFCSDDRSNEFWCPVCNEVLFYNEDDAIAFLKGNNINNINNLNNENRSKP